MRLLDVGENLARLRRDFPEFWESHADNDWRRAVGLRNVVAHEYGSVDLNTIWQVITRDLGWLSASLTASIEPGTNQDDA